MSSGAIEICKDQSFWVSDGEFSHLISADVHVTEKSGRDRSSDPQVFDWRWSMRGWATVFGQTVWLRWCHHLKMWSEDLDDKERRLGLVEDRA